MKAQLKPILAVGHRLYHFEQTIVNGKLKSEVLPYEIRSIQKRRGSQSSWGSKFSYQSDYTSRRFVHLTAKIDHTTWCPKKAKWMPSISKVWRKSFDEADERLPDGFYTTKLQALKYGLKEQEEWLQSESTELVEAKTDGDADWIAELEESVADVKKLIPQIKRMITKELKGSRK